MAASSRKSRKAVIIGGGISGLTAAICLARRGWAIEILEQAAELAEVGAGIQLSPNAMRVFGALGMAQDIIAAGFKPRAMQMRMGRSGRVITTSQINRGPNSPSNAPYIHIHRADLIAVLQAALENLAPGAIKTGVHVAAINQDEDQAFALTKAGGRHGGDVIVGADGINSLVRAALFGPDAARFTGNAAWRATVPVAALGRDAPLPAATVWMGDGRHAVTYLLRGGTLANFVGVTERGNWLSESWSEPGPHSELVKDFGDWHPAIAKIVQQAANPYRWALFDREPKSQWSAGRAVLIGDAAHPMLPFLAQGAAQGIEDSYVLAKMLDEAGDIPNILNDFTAVRSPRTARVQQAARANMDIFHRRGEARKLSAYGPIWLADMLTGSAMFDARMEWLYSFDATE